jgi:hypothetical protein
MEGIFVSEYQVKILDHWINCNEIFCLVWQAQCLKNDKIFRMRWRG